MIDAVVVKLFVQEGVDAAGCAQVHAWAEIPEVLAGVYLSGGLKKIRRLVESYFSYRFSQPAAKRVRGRWTRGEPSMLLNWYRIPGLHGRTLAHLGRLRSTATNDVYRGYLEILGGDTVEPAAVLEHRPWPEDFGWVAPSAGEFDIQSVRNRPPYLGVFETRVQRTPAGCTLHLMLIDFPVARAGRGARWWQQPWQPMTAVPNMDFLRVEIESVARAAGHAVRFEASRVPGTPAGLRAAHVATPPAVHV